MHRRYNLGRLILASAVVLSLTLMMVAIDAQARIAFMSDRDWNWEIYVMDADGENRLNLTNNRGHTDRSPSWSPDGRRIVFGSSRREDAGNLEIYVMDADGENQRNLTINDTHDNNPSWSPNGKHIAFDSFGPGAQGIDIYVMDADGKNQRNLTNHPDRDRAPSWSPDSKRIAFVSNRTRDFNPDLYVMDADGANPRNLTNHPEDEGAPAWYNSVLSVTPAGKILTMWGQLKQIDR